ncbi:tRNA (adenosine(37)-N6)-threonylcarbamoyltransferase complex dimerization subunit type 1 TsaB [Akkermansiaceae bacterium]|nr:tRNA (adenosine(37)-N6)-threonylcarbamoyltransferase complex dimerization subunit type 1 TsaB [Akkermansiaceae bacterium]
MESILAIETSVPEASIALWSDGAWLFEAEFISDRNHNSMVFEPLAEALALLEGRELSTVLVGTGPGSYSGTRIGIAAAQGLAIAKSCPAAGIGSIAATPPARSVGVSAAHTTATAIGDARRGLYYISPITASGEAEEPELMDAAVLEQRLASIPDDLLFTLDDPTKLGLNDQLQERITRTQPQARLLVDVWLGLDELRRQQLHSKPLAPTYLRAPFTSKAKQGHPLLRKG